MERGFHMIIFKEGVNIPNVIRKVQMKYGVDIAPYVTGRHYDMFIDVALHQAITQQMKELGWL
jgi:hypothetical protein